MRSFLRAVLWVAIVVAILVGAARATAIRWWRVPDDDPYLTASIAPTLRGGDLVILWRLSAPSYGDLVLCPEPAGVEENSSNAGRIVIGRIVGEGQDTVEIKRATVFVNGEALPTESGCNERTFSVDHPETENEVEQHCSLERVGSNLHMIGGLGPDLQPPLNRELAEVNPGQVWLASDNRILPYDSRDYGPVDRDACTETVVFRLVSERGYFDSENRLTLIH